jgi:glycosyltransferase
MFPSLSIITVVRNGATTIADCLASVRQQSYAAEHLVIDGCSTDNTLDIVARVNPQAYVMSEPDQGMYDALNKGIGLTTGEVIGILHADDLYAGPQVLEQVAEVFRDEAIDSCYGDLLYVDRHDSQKIVRYWRAGTFHRENFYWGWMPPHPTFFVRRRIYERFDKFRLDLGSAADYELMLRLLLQHRISTCYIPQILVKMRVGGMSNRSLQKRILANQMDRLAWKINDLRPYPWTLWLKPLRKIRQYWQRSQ